MSNSTNGTSGCAVQSWSLAALVGLFTTVLLLALGGEGIIASLFLGGLVFALLGGLFSWLFCAPLPEMGAAARDAAQASAPVVPAAEPAAETPPRSATPIETPAPAESASAPVAPAGDTGPSTAPAPAQAEPVIKPSAALPGQAELAERKGTWRYSAEDAGTEAASEPASEADYDKDGVVEGSDEGTKPQLLTGPRPEGADDLKHIKGIGPKLESLCHSLGIYHFDQIASWTEDEVAWVNANLDGFKGRVSRDEWVAQARLLAGGGETEFSKRVDKGGVY
ncbi:hypothetical protein [Pseudoponticoccus marisrubri]|uniref:ATP synthase subunit E n=1 Tax=Pseudoponticoccus marisrubri TaxID=1685382 RepID=A0A0W7WEX8_9RHOB|nr:hypothetical protein AVJ23_19365 [Pseudoponticoccus marisrubri]